MKTRSTSKPEQSLNATRADTFEMSDEPLIHPDEKICEAAQRLFPKPM